MGGGAAEQQKTDERHAVTRSSSGDDDDFCSEGPNSGSDDLRADAAARRTPPMPKLVRQGRAEGCRVGVRSVGGPGYLVGGRTSSSCRGGSRRRERLRSHSGPRARHAAAASATDGERPSPRSLREGAGHRPRRGRPQLGTLPSPPDFQHAQHGGPGPRVMQPARRMLRASNCTATRATTAPPRLRNQYRDSRRPSARPSSASLARRSMRPKMGRQ
jgi:hypothetical protein